MWCFSFFLVAGTTAKREPRRDWCFCGEVKVNSRPTRNQPLAAGKFLLLFSLKGWWYSSIEIRKNQNFAICDPAIELAWRGKFNLNQKDCNHLNDVVAYMIGSYPQSFPKLILLRSRSRLSRPFETSHYHTFGCFQKYGKKPKSSHLFIGFSAFPLFSPSILGGVKSHYSSRWWFQTFFILIPTWGRFPFWRAYFS